MRAISCLVERPRRTVWHTCLNMSIPSCKLDLFSQTPSTCTTTNTSASACKCLRLRPSTTARWTRCLPSSNQHLTTESNPMVEAFWRSLKHNWLYPNSLDSTERLRSLVDFYVQAHNNQRPHPAFHGHTPDEIYAASAPTLLQELADNKAAAPQRRLAANHALSCARCTVSLVFSAGLHLHPPAS